jgi:hypothetical protein
LFGAKRNKWAVFGSKRKQSMDVFGTKREQNMGQGKTGNVLIENRLWDNVVSAPTT